MTDLDNLEEAAYNLIEKYSKLSGVKRSNSLLVLGQKFQRFERRCIKLAGEHYVQVLNPRTDRWVKIDTSTGNIVAHKKSKGEFKGIRKSELFERIEKPEGEKNGKIKSRRSLADHDGIMR